METPALRGATLRELARLLGGVTGLVPFGLPSVAAAPEIPDLQRWDVSESHVRGAARHDRLGGGASLHREWQTFSGTGPGDGSSRCGFADPRIARSIADAFVAVVRPPMHHDRILAESDLARVDFWAADRERR